MKALLTRQKVGIVNRDYSRLKAAKTSAKQKLDMYRSVSRRMRWDQTEVARKNHGTCLIPSYCSCLTLAIGWDHASARRSKFFPVCILDYNLFEEHIWVSNVRPSPGPTNEKCHFRLCKDIKASRRYFYFMY